MAVYTEVAAAEAGALFERLGLGPLTALHGIGSGIENTNYDAVTPRGRWVLTLFERLDVGELPYYLSLMQHLAARGIPVPAPQADAHGCLVHRLAGKPAAVVTRLPGSHRLQPHAAHGAQLGAVLARMHLAGRSAPLQQPHPRGLPWCRATAAAVAPQLGAAQRTLLADEIAWQDRFERSPAAARLPAGPLHADLFRDNVVFEPDGGGDRLSGVFDFYFSGTDPFVFDLAVCLNDWCTDDATLALDPARTAAFVDGYAAERALQPDETAALPVFLRRAALRFWLSRLDDLQRPRDAALLQPKDPSHFERVLRARITAPAVDTPPEVALWAR